MKQIFVNLFSKKGILCLFFCMSVGQFTAQEYLPTVDSVLVLMNIYEYFKKWKRERYHNENYLYFGFEQRGLF